MSLRVAASAQPGALAWPACLQVTISVQQTQAPACDSALCMSLVSPGQVGLCGGGQLSVAFQQLLTLDSSSGVGKVFPALA